MSDAAYARLVSANEWLRGVEEQTAAVLTRRNQAILELRDAGWSYDRIATGSGITKARVAQICQAAGKGRVRADER